MQIMFNEDCDQFCIVMDKKEARALCNACTEVTEPSGKKLNKRSKDWKVAYEIAQELPVW